MFPLPGYRQAVALRRPFGMLGLLSALVAGCATYPPAIPESEGHIKAEPRTTRSADIPAPVRTSSFLPPPQPTVRPQTFSVVVNEVPVKEILFALARDSGKNVDIQPGVEGFVTLNAINETFLEILDRVSKQVNVRVEIDARGTVTVMPDSPYIKTYRIDYVNLERETTSEIGVSTLIAGTGATSGSGTSGSPAGSANNMSSTKVKSSSSSKFWKTIEQNIKDILLETDKEIVISRRSSLAQDQATRTSDTNVAASGKGVAGGAGDAVAGSGNQSVQGAASSTGKAQSEQDFKEYKTLFAATVFANPDTGVLSVRANSRQHKKVEEFLNTVMHFAKRQVLIEATIVEVALNDAYQAGVDWSRIADTGSMSQNLLGAKLQSSPNFTFKFATSSDRIGNIDITVKALETFGNTKVLSSPKIMALNNQTAILKVVENLVYFTVTANTTTNQATTTTTYSSQPNTVPVGLVLSVTPQVNDNGLVSLVIRPTISRRVDWVIDPNPDLAKANPKVENRIPLIQVREMESVLQVNSGNTVILGGLMQDDSVKSREGIPLLSRLPGMLGDVFSYRDENSKKTELVIFLRPTVIEQPSLESAELNSFQRYLPQPPATPLAKP